LATFRAAAVKDVVHGVETKLSNEDAGRFLARMSQVGGGALNEQQG
jgi:hypothetical protein